jgi:SAM-dependent methyltransferase
MARSMEPIAVYFTKGLADVVTAEIRQLVPVADADEPADRFVIARVDDASLGRLRSAGRTFDDIRLLVAGPAAITDLASFDRLCEQARSAADHYLQACDQPRADSRPWSVTMSARSPRWREAPGWDPSGPIGAWFHGADLSARSRAPVDLRIQVDGDQGHISLNLFSRPQGKREAGPDRRGALRPSVAAALVRLALQAASPSAIRHGLYDPCCGTGTILAEAARLSVPVYGSDLDGEAVTAATDRLVALTGAGSSPLAARVFRHDLLRGVPRDVPARIVASNLPWGKQIRLPSRTDLFDAVARLTARGIAEGGASVLLTTGEQQLVARIRRHAPQARITTRRIGLLGQTPAVVLAESDHTGPAQHRSRNS